MLAAASCVLKFFFFALGLAVVVVGLVEECMVCLGQQHFGRKEQAAVVVVEG